VALFEFIELFTFSAKISPIRKYYFGLGNVRVYAAAVAAAANPDLFISGGQMLRFEPLSCTIGTSGAIHYKVDIFPSLFLASITYQFS
jgi:hypothetical protein